MKELKLIGALLLLALVGCQKYETKYGVAATENTDLKTKVWDMVYSTEYGIFLLNADFSRSKKIIDFIPLSYASISVSLSHDRQKIAYVDPSTRSVKVVDTAGTVLHNLTMYNNVDDLGWFKGDSTLYMLTNNQIQFWGKALDLPNPVFNLPLGVSFLNITALDISDDLDVLYGFSYREYNAAGDSMRWLLQKNINYKSTANDYSQLDTVFYKKLSNANYGGDFSYLRMVDTASYDINYDINRLHNNEIGIAEIRNYSNGNDYVEIPFMFSGTQIVVSLEDNQFFFKKIDDFKRYRYGRIEQKWDSQTARKFIYFDCKIEESVF